MADPLAPQDIARHTFDVARRGYEQQEVRGFLHEVSALVERLTRSTSELRERAERAEARLGDAGQPDEAVLLEVLGAETTRVLTSAREAAAEIRSKAEASAERIIAEATSEVADIRSNALQEVDALIAQTKAESEAILEAARTELERRSAEAQDAAARIRADGQEQAQASRAEGQEALARAREEAEAALEAARQQGREMVAEAQTVRERVLRDLAVRRKRARQQVEKLNAGRERLLQAYEVVRRTIDEATNELTVSLTDARIAANAAARRIEDEPDTTLEQLDAEVAAAGLIDLPIVEIDDDDHGDVHDDDSSGPLSGEVPAVEGSAVPADAAPEEAPSAEGLSELPWLSGAVDERRGRRGRRKKGFDGLPAGELTIVAPPSADEGVRILDEPPDAAGDPSGANATAADAPVATEPESVAEAAPHDAAPEGADDAASPEGDPHAVSHEPASGETPVDASAEVAPVEVAPEASDVEPETGTRPADDVFARLRAQNEPGDGDVPDGVAAPTETVDGDADGDSVTADPTREPIVVAGEVEGTAADLPDSPTEEPDAGGPAGASAGTGPFAARAAVVGPIEKELGRRLKRTLADEQNEVLDLLRRAKPKGVDDLLPAPDLHAARWADPAVATLGEAAAAGASGSGGTTGSVADLADELARELTAPLRERIDRSFSASDGNLDDIADRVRALYREWKGRRLSEAAQHYAAAAYARGVFDAIDAGAKVQWTLDPSVGACPDCDDNVLAGAITKGDDFPTGNPCAPAHPGCHCLVLASSD